MSKIGDLFNSIMEKVLGPNQEVLYGKSQDSSETIPDQETAYYSNPKHYNSYCQSFFRDRKNFDMQYDYFGLLSYMKKSGAIDRLERDLDEIDSHSKLYFFSAVHGISHTKRVTFFAEALCSLDNVPESYRNLIIKAAELHDIGRKSDLSDPNHGLAGKQKIKKLNLLSGYSKKSQEIIEFAVECHSLSKEEIKQKLEKIPKKDRKDFELVLNYLKDADKLDRVRIKDDKSSLNPTRLTTKTAKRLVKVAHINYIHFEDKVTNQIIREKEDRVARTLDLAKKQGINIDIDFLNEILNSYRTETLAELTNEEKLEDVFSYKTFIKYRNNPKVNCKKYHDELFKQISRIKQIDIQDFDKNFMLYYNLERNHNEEFNIYLKSSDGIPDKRIVALSAYIKLEDLEKFNEKGYHFRISDLYNIASNLTPEEYKEIIESGNLQDIFSSKYERSRKRANRILDQLDALGLNYSDEFLDENYRLIEEILKICPQILKNKDIQKYPLHEVYSIIVRINDSIAKFEKKDPISYTEQDILDLIEFSKANPLIYESSEREQLDIIKDFVKNRERIKEPKYIEYRQKRNKPYYTTDVDNILNYNKYCIDRILSETDISLKDAKSKLINGLFNFSANTPKKKKEFEREIIEELYFHKKYLPNSELYKLPKNPIGIISKILNSKNLTEFEELLRENSELISNTDFQKLADRLKEELTIVSKEDIVSNLQSTGEKIHSMSTTVVQSATGEPVSVKVLSGDEFYLAVSTIMPFCCSRAGDILEKKSAKEAENEIYQLMLKRKYQPDEKCTAIISNKMIAHAKSSLENQELLYGFIPESKEKVSLIAVHDLSSVRDANNNRIRKTSRVTTPRKIQDFVNGTREEHNEAVITSGYPDFIICFDRVSDIAIRKREQMQRFYDSAGINKKIEIVLVEGEKTYLPRIKNEIIREHELIKEYLKTGNLTKSRFKLMFENPESNFTLRTLQAIHSTMYRDDLWDPKFNKKILNSLVEILGELSKVISNSKASVLLDQVNMLLERKQTGLYYDNTYKKSIDDKTLKQIKELLEEKVKKYEKVSAKKKTDSLANDEVAKTEKNEDEKALAEEAEEPKQIKNETTKTERIVDEE